MDGEVDLWSTPNLIVGNVVELFALAFLLVGTVLFIIRRDHFPVQGRGIKETLTINALLVGQLINFLARGPHYPCFISDIFHTLGLHAAVLVYVWRVTTLLVHSQMSDDIELRPSWVNPNQSRNVSFLAPRGWLHMRSLLRFRHFVLFLLMYLSIAMIIFLSLAYSLGRPYTCYEIFPISSLGILALVSCPMFITLACKLRKYPRDGRYLITEFRGVSLSTFLSILLFIAIKLFTPEEYSGNYFLALAVVGATCSSCLLPVFLSFRYDKFVITRAKSLDELLATTTGVQSFLEFLKTEFSAENLVFYIAIQDYKSRPGRTIPEIKREAFNIRDTFIVRNAPYQVNASSKATEALVTKLTQELDEASLLAVFDEVSRQCFDLMRQDSFPRYCAVEHKLYLSKESQMFPRFTPRSTPSHSTSTSCRGGGGSGSCRGGGGGSSSYQPMGDSSYSGFLSPPSSATLSQRTPRVPSLSAAAAAAILGPVPGSSSSSSSSTCSSSSSSSPTSTVEFSPLTSSTSMVPPDLERPPTPLP